MAHTAVPDYLHSFPIPTPFPVGPVNAYLAEGDPLTLVDVGPHYEPARKALEEGLAAYGYGVSDLGRIVLTHAHADHCGLAAELARASGAEVLADKHESRARRILGIVGNDALTAHEIAGVLFPRLDAVNYFLAISEVVGHLEWQEVERHVACDERGGVARWRRVD